MAGQPGAVGFEAQRDRLGAAALLLGAATRVTGRSASTARSTLAIMSPPCCSQIRRGSAGWSRTWPLSPKSGAFDEEAQPQRSEGSVHPDPQRVAVGIVKGNGARRAPEHVGQVRMQAPQQGLPRARGE